MTPVKGVTTIHALAWLCHAVERRIVVTGLAPVMLPTLYTGTI